MTESELNALSERVIGSALP